MYGGIEYRSRLEARWAAFFDQLGWRHTYEPFDGAGYIPDFLIHDDPPLLVEVKPAVTKAQYEAAIDKMTIGLASVWDGDMLIVGADPLPHGSIGWRTAEFKASTYRAAGLFGRCGLDENDAPEWLWAEAMWFSCAGCGQCGLITSLGSVVSFCDHEDVSVQYDNDVTAENVAAMWANACNAVKWRGTPTEERGTDAPWDDALRSIFKNLQERGYGGAV
jgi:hypothetical protein